MKDYLYTIPKRLVLTLQAVIASPILLTYYLWSEDSSFIKKASWYIGD